MEENNFILMLQAMLDKVKSVTNIKKDIKSIEPKLKIKLKGVLDKSFKKDMNTTLKSIKPKIKIDADTSKAVQKIKQIGKQKTTTTIRPTVDNSQVMSSLKETQKETKSLFDRFLNGVVGVNLVRISVQKVTQAIYQAITGLKELDKIKTDIQMVSGTSDSGVDAMMQSYNAMAKELSSTTKSVSEAANEFLRMGESVASTNELIKSSQVLSKVGMIESSEAASYLISSLKGYKVEAEDSINIIDKLTSVDLEAAVSAGGLAEAMSRCANIANSSGTSMDRLIGYMATAGEVTQDSMSVIGNSFKSMYSRMNNIKIGRFIDDETGESLSDTEAVLDKLGIKLRDTEDTYRNFDDVLDDVGNNWKNFTQVEQNAISVAIAGTMQRERFIALMNNYSSALKYSETAANSAGSALERYGMYKDSIEAKTNELTAAIESLSTNTISEDLFSGIIQATTGVVEFIDKFGILKGTLAGLVAMGISKTFVSMATGIVSAAKSTTQLTAAMAMFRNGSDVDNLRNIGAVCKGLSDKQLKLILSTKGLINEDREQILTGMGVAEAEREQTLATLGLASAENTATASTFSLKNAWAALKVAVVSNPIGATITAITAAVTVGTMVFSGFNQVLDDIRQKADELGNTFNSTKTEIEDYKTKIEELHDVINNSGSSIEDVTEARKSLMSIQDELIGKFGAERSAVESITRAVNGQTEAFDELSQKQWQQVKNEFNDSGFGNDILNLFDGYGSNIDRMLDEYGNYEVKVDLSYASSNYKSKEAQEIRELLESNGMEISYTMNGKGVPFVELSGTADEVHDKIVEIQELFSEDNPLSSDIFSDYLTGLANSAKDMSRQYKEMYDNYILYEEVLNDNSYRDSFKGITEAYEEYRAAEISGDEGAIAKASDNYASVVGSAMEEAFKNGDTSVADYFESMYPELQDAIGQWEFKAKVLPDFDMSGLKGKTEDDVLEMLQTGGMQDGEETFNSLIEKAAEYGIVTGENSEKVQQLLDLLVELGILQGEISKDAQDIPIPSFADAFDSLDTDVQQKLLDLAKSGEITAVTLSSTEEYNALLTQTGLSAESAKNQILDMLSAQEKLSGAANGLDKLKSSYEQFKETGFVTAQSLESLPDAFKELEGFDLFSETVGDPTQGAERIQQAFNDIVKEYLISQDTLSGLVNASESEVQSYIANLRDMGVTNAEEVVNATIQAMSQENELLNAAEKEYMDYLMAKDGYDDEYLKSVTSKNGQLVGALGSAYKGDYDNWCGLLSKKAQAYNRFVSLINKSQQAASFSGSPLSDYGKAKAIVRESAGKTPKQTAPQVSGFANQKNQSAYTKEQIDAAKDYVRQHEEAQKMKEELKLDVSLIDTNFSTGYSPKGSGSSGSGGSSKDAKEEAEKEFSEVFDWIERRIRKFQRSFDKWVKQAETAVTSNFVNKYYKKAQSSAKNQLSTYGKAYNRYMRNANAVGLDEKYARKVRNGTINIEEIRAKGTEAEVKKYEELADRIKEYQDWYDKAQDSMDSFLETAEKLYNLPLEKAARKVDIFRDAIDLLGKEIDNETDYTKKNKKIDRQTQKEKKILDANKAADTDTKKLLNSAKKELRKNRNLNADDGITKKERQKIKSTTNKNQEVNLSYFKENSAGYKAAVKYNEALKARKKAINEAKSAQQDYNAWLVEASKLKFDNVADHYSKEVQMIGYDMSALDGRISEIEASGRKANKSYYEDQKEVNAQKLAQYQSEKAALEQSIQNIKKGTDEWYDAYDQIQQVSSSISDCTKETYELNDAISQLHFDMVDDTTEGIRRIITEQEFLRGLFAHEKNTDKKTGGLTDAGLANLGSLSAGYNLSKENASMLAAEVAELQRMLDAGETYSSLLGIELNSIDNVEKRLNEARATEQEWVKERYDNASAIHGIMEELYNAELGYLKELVDAKKEALDAEKDLHDYQKAISGKTEGIAAIQKQIAAYSGDTSEEGRAKLQRLQKELDDKKDDLKETEYDRYVSDQKEMLDDLYDEYSKKIEEKIEDFMALVQEGLDKADDNMSGIRDFLDKIASGNGYETATKGLFDSYGVWDASNGTTSTTGIGDNARDAAAQVADNEKEKNESTKPETAQPTDPPFEGNKFTEHKPPALVDDSSLRNDAKKYIGEKAVKAKKKKKEYSDVSQKVYDNKAKSYKGTGKVLTTAAMKGLAKLLGVEYDNASKNGRLYKKLKSIKFPGFRKGGVVSVDDIEKQVRANGDTSLVSAQNGEGFVEKEHVKPIKELVESVPEINKLAKALSGIPETDGIIRTPDGIELAPVSQEECLSRLFARSSGKDVPAKNISFENISNAIKNAVPDLNNITKHSLSNIQNVKNTSTTTNIDIGGITMNGVNDPEEFSRQVVNSIQNYPKVQNAIHASSMGILSGSGRFYVDRVLK